MRYITKIRLINFQSHKDTTIIPAGPGEITVLAGPSDTGKSTVIRALDWLFNNNWDPSYLRHNCKSVEVQVHYSDGYVVTIHRGRTTSTNYSVRFPGKPEQKFEGIGRNVPQEIQAITGVHPVEFGDASFVLNISKQDVGPFLGHTVSNPQRARILGALAGTDEVDMAARMLKNQLLKDKQKQEKLTADIADLDTKISEYDYLDALAAVTAEVEILLASIQSNAELKGKLQRILQRFNTLKDLMMGNNLDALELGNGVVRITPILENGLKKSALHDTLSTILQDSKRINTSIDEQNAVLEITAEADPAVQLLLELHNKGTLLDRFMRLSGVRQQTGLALSEASALLCLTESLGVTKEVLEGTESDAVVLDKLASLRDKKARAQLEIDKVEKILADTSTAPESAYVVDSALEDDVLYGKLRTLLQRGKELSLQISEAAKTLAQTAGVEEGSKVFIESEGRMGNLVALLGLLAKKKSLDAALVSASADIERYGKNVEESSKRYVQTLKEMGVCEVCGSEVTDQGIERII